MLNLLPQDMVGIIFSFLSPNVSINALQLSISMHHAVKDSSVWSNFAIQYFSKALIHAINARSKNIEGEYSPYHQFKALCLENCGTCGCLCQWKRKELGRASFARYCKLCTRIQCGNCYCQCHCPCGALYCGDVTSIVECFQCNVRIHCLEMGLKGRYCDICDNFFCKNCEQKCGNHCEGCDIYSCFMCNHTEDSLFEECAYCKASYCPNCRYMNREYCVHGLGVCMECEKNVCTASLCGCFDTDCSIACVHCENVSCGDCCQVQQCSTCKVLACSACVVMQKCMACEANMCTICVGSAGVVLCRRCI